MRRSTTSSSNLPRLQRETVLITGASSGIGLELARLFAADGSDLVLVARNKARLDQLGDELSQQHGVSVRVIAADLADPASPTSVFDQVTTGGSAVDVLVNNAGFGSEGAFLQLRLERILDMVQVNLTALTHLTRLFLEPMVQRGHGGILNVASTAAFQPGPFQAVYFATKAYVLSLTEALAEELAGRGIRLTCLAPGATQTEFAARAHMEDALLFRLAPMDAAAVAQAGHRGFRAGKLLVVPGLKNKLGVAAVRFVPRWLARKVAARLNRPA